MFPILLVLVLAALSVAFRKLTPMGGLAGVFVAGSLYVGLGYSGLALLGAFFVLGTLATSYRKQWKEGAGLRDNVHGRKAVQVWSNGGVAALCSLLSFWYAPYAPRDGVDMLTGREIGDAYLVFQLMTAAALSSATADTLASELGNVWGRRYINIRTLRRDSRGVDGAISLEGTLAGLAGSTVIALLYFYGVERNTASAGILVLAGTFGNLADSWLGATLQRRGLLSNDAVNALNTLLAAALVLLLELLS
ncbi:MAG: DUF92 domain-containing protein [Chitinophagaceae bacterium]|nr:MAG: DUF92 domain-containing protein [Chitinophagaceae bacterium]